MTTWQPIDTAPKDGRKLLMWNPKLEEDALVLFWMGGHWREPANLMWFRTDPTHWMPIPAPPERR